MKRKPGKKICIADAVSELLEIANLLTLPDGAFDGEIDDECAENASRQAEKIKGSVLMEQLEFLLAQGFAPSRLKQLIEEYAGRDTD